MGANNFLLQAFSISPQGSGEPIPEEALSQAVKSEQLTWVHLDGNQPESKNWLESELTYLDNIIVEALLAEATRPRILEFEQGTLLILRGVNLNTDSHPEDMV